MEIVKKRSEGLLQEQGSWDHLIKCTLITSQGYNGDNQVHTLSTLVCYCREFMSCGMKPAGELFKTLYFTSSCTKKLKSKDGVRNKTECACGVLPSGAVVHARPRLTSCVSDELFRMLTFRVLDSPSRVAGNVYRSWGEYTPLRTASSGLAKHSSCLLARVA